jgi:hypothetical protein
MIFGRHLEAAAAAAPATPAEAPKLDGRNERDDAARRPRSAAQA